MTVKMEIKIETLKVFCKDQDKVLKTLYRYKNAQKTIEGQKRHQNAIDRAELLKRAALHYIDVVKGGGDSD